LDMVCGATFGHLSLCRFSVHCGVTLGALRRSNLFVLFVAVYNGHVHILQFIKKWSDVVANKLQSELEPLSANPPCSIPWRGPLSIDDIRVESNHLLKRAVKNDDLKMCQFLKEWTDTSGDRLTFRDVDESNALNIAVKRGNLAMLHFFDDWAQET